MEECIFCKIVSGEINARVIFEDGDFIAFLDKSPIFKGHSLLIPKKHIETLFDFPQETLKEMIVRVRRVAEGVKEALSADGMLLINNNVISQSVPHFHMHIIPRRKGESLTGFMWPRTKYNNEDEEEEFRKKIEKSVKRLK